MMINQLYMDDIYFSEEMRIFIWLKQPVNCEYQSLDYSLSITLLFGSQFFLPICILKNYPVIFDSGRPELSFQYYY